MSELGPLFVLLAAVGAELVGRARWSSAVRAAAWAGLVLLPVPASGALTATLAPGEVNRQVACLLAVAAAVAAAKTRRDGRPRATALLWGAAAVWGAAAFAGDPEVRPTAPGPALAVLLVTCAALTNRPVPDAPPDDPEEP